jgi:hypothetical protein
MDSLSRSAFIIYILHYIYVLWLQRALMGINIHASLKFSDRVFRSDAVELDNRSVRADVSAASPCVLGGYFEERPSCSGKPEEFSIFSNSAKYSVDSFSKMA